MANQINPSNSQMLNTLPVNAGRFVTNTISITGDTEVVTYASYRLSFTFLIDIASTSDLNTDEISQYRDGHLKISICKDNPILTPAELTSSCNDTFFTDSNSLKINLCKDNPLITPVELTSSCDNNNIFFTKSNSTIKDMKYYGNKVFE